MTTPAIPYMALLSYRAVEAKRWLDYFTANPKALDVVVGEGRTATVRGLVLHVHAVDLRYGQRLLGEPVSEFADIKAETTAELFAIGDQGHDKLTRFLATAETAALEHQLTFKTLSAGTITASVQRVLVHTLTHGIRHWAQIATALRQHGQPKQWFHDLLLADFPW